MGRLATWLVACALLGAAPAWADPAYDRCMKQSGDTNVAWGECGSAWIGREEVRLNAAWRRVAPRIDGTAGAALLAEQRAWVAYKDLSCQLYATGDYGREGQVLHYPICRAGVLAARTRELEALGDFVGR